MENMFTRFALVLRNAFLWVLVIAFLGASDAWSQSKSSEGGEFKLTKRKPPRGLTEEQINKAGFNFKPSLLKGDKNGRLGIAASLQNPTSLQFGPDGKLYVSQLNGLIKVFTIVKNGPNDYSIANQETIYLINEIPNHNDDGTLAPSVTTRQVTGLLVAGTATNPILYVSSSDSRIGGPAGDLNLDTNSGIVSKLTKTANGWDKVDLVRGLPRSEENHSVEGLARDGNMLYLAIGGHTNAGAPSTTFAYTPEYALSAAILSIDLAAIEAMPTKGSGNNKYKYDLPTLDDPSRPGNPDFNDPFGGNDGLNQAKIVPGGPVQVFATGFRNAYDLVITKSRRMYVTDNGANPGWGGHPENEGTPNVNNNYVSGEPGSTGPGPNDPKVNNLDHFHYVGDLNTYVPGSYYAGHPHPIRANPAGAGLYTHDNGFGVWRTSKTGIDPLPADWPPVPVSMARPIEGDFQNPGETNNALLTFNSSTNGITEYTASNFNNGLKGHLLAASFDGTIQDIILNASGTDVLNERGTKKKNLSMPFANNFGSQPLDITAQGDNDIFPGTVWVVCYLQNSIYVFEPSAGSGECVAAYSTSFDDDGDGYSNADEIDNGTNPCSSASRPSDADGDFLSDYNDPDDDNDGLNDDVDYFPLDAANGMATHLPIEYELFNGDPGTGLYGLGFTGLMLPKTPGINYQDLFDPENLIAGGAVGALGIENTSPGDALRESNTQENGFQFGVNLNSSTGPFTVQTRLLGPFFNYQTPQPHQSQGLYIGIGDQDNYLKIVVGAGGTGSLEVVYENNGVATSQKYLLPNGLPASTLDLFLSVDPATGLVQPKYANDNGQITSLGSPIQVNGLLLEAIQGTHALAVGIISTSKGSTSFTATWDLIRVTLDAPTNIAPVLASIGTKTGTVNQPLTFTAQATDADVPAQTLTYSLTGPSSATINPGTGVFNWTPTVSGTYSFTVKVTDNGTPALSAQQVVTVNVGDGAIRINSGGGAYLASGGRQFAADMYFADGSNSSVSAATAIANTTDDALYQNDHFGAFSYNIPVSNGYYKVILHFAETFPLVVNGSTNRKFHLDIEGVRKLTQYDIAQRAGGMLTAIQETIGVTVTDGVLNILFTKGTSQSPTISALEVIPATAPGNEAPIVTTPLMDQSTLADKSFSYGFAAGSFTDPENDPLTYTATLQNNDALPAWLSFNASTRTFSGTAPSGSPNLAVKVTANDGKGNQTSDIFILEVITPTPNTPPMLAPIGNKTATLGQPLAFKIRATDNDIPAQTITYSVAGPVSANMNSATGDFSWTPTVSGTFSFTFNATDNGTPVMSTQEVITVTVNAAQTGTSTVRLNAAGPSFLATGGRVFAADTYFDGGLTASAGNVPIANTTDDALYQTERYGPFSYNIPLNSGYYNVILHFAETYSGVINGTHTRKFNVDVEGVRRLTEYDIAQQAGGTLKALQETIGVSVTDGTLNIVFSTGSAQSPKVNAIEVVAATPPSNQILSFSLINADTDQDIKVLTSGEQINLKDMPTRRLSIRANANPSRIGSVRMVLSGALSRTQTDNGFPYALFGDNSGDYNPWTPAVGNYSLTATPYTGTGATGTAGSPLTINFTVIDPVNQPPVVAAALINQSATIGTAFTYQFGAGSFTDPDGDALTYSASLSNNAALPAWLTFNASTRTFSGTPPSGSPTSLTIKVTANDGKGGSVSSSFVLSITTQPNTAPSLAAIGNKTLTLGQSLSFTAQGTDSDLPAQTLSYSLTGPASASLNASTGAFSWTPTSTGTTSLTIKVTDSGSPALSAQEVISVTVNPAVAAGLRINAGGGAYTSLDGRQFVADTYFSGGSTRSEGNVPIDNTEDDALYQTERYGNFSYNIPVSNGYYDVILHFSENFSGVINGTTSRKFNVDMEGVRRLTEYDIAQQAGGTLKAHQQSLGVRVTDGTLNVVFSAGSVQSPKVSAIEVVAGTAPANRAPVVASGLVSQSATVGTSFSYQFAISSFTDADGDALTYSASLSNNAALPAWLSFEASSRTFSGTPTSSTPSSLTVKVTASDGRGGSVSSSFVLSITTQPNTAPSLAAIGNKTLTLGQSLSFTAQGTDSDLPAQTLSYSLTGPASASLNASTGAFSWTPTSTGTTSLTIKVTDSGSPALSAQEVISVTVNPAVAAGLRINAGGGGYTSLDGRQFVADTYFSGGSTRSEGNVPIDNTEDDALYQTERYGNFSYNIPVSNGYYDVILHFSENFSGVINGTTSRKFNVDMEGVRRLTEYDIAQQAGGTLKAHQQSLGVRVTDGTLNVVFSAGSVQSPKVSAIEVVAGTAPANRAPVVASGLVSQSATVGTSFSYQFAISSFTDADGDALTYSASLSNNAALPAWLSFNSATRTFSGTPTSSAPSSLTVKVTASDGKGGSVSGNFELTIVTPVVNQPPVVATALVNQSATVGTAFSYQFGATSFTDADGDALTYSAALSTDTALPAWLSFEASSRTFSGTPPSGSPTSLTIKVTASDGKGGSVSGSFQISITTPVVNTAPSLAAIGNKTLTLGQSLSFTAQGTDSDLPAQTLSYSLTGPASASLNASTGAFSWTPTSTGTTSLTIKVTDSGSPALSAQEVISVTVNPAGQQVTSFSLMNADTKEEIKVLTPGEQLNLATLPTRRINIRANTDPGVVGSVRMVLSGRQSRTQTDNGVPYALYGDNNGNYNAWTPLVGSHTLVGTPYTGTGATGTAGTALTINFTVIDQAPVARVAAGNAETATIIVNYFPNPFTQSFKLTVEGKGSEKLPVSIYDLLGREVITLDDVEAEQTITFGKEHVPGIYLLRVGVGNAAKHYKLVKVQ